MKIGLTPKQRELLDYIEAYSQESGASPSYQQMMERLGLHSKSGVHRLVKALEERGHISRLANRARSITVQGSWGWHIYLTPDLDDRLKILADAAGKSPQEIIVGCVVDRLYPAVEAAA
jgi:SOS-response transcriptional repressor LexA